MDVKREQRPQRTKQFTLLMVAVLLLGIITWQISQPQASQRVSKDQVWLGTVQAGQLKLQVEGFGKLQSKYQRLLTARVGGIVEEILLKPGAAVTKDSVILRLWNPELDQQVATETLLLSSEQANLRQLKVNLKRELLAQQARLAELEANLGTASFRLEATTRLVDKGIVSQLDHKEAQLQSEQYEKRLHIEKQRLNQLTEVHQESIKIQQEKIHQQQAKLDAILAKQQRLTVRASIDGVLQRLPVELGQSVPEGELLAFVGGTEQLIAEINVSQSQVERIEIGQSVDIDTRGAIAQGEVTRIDPVVNAGTVLVEVELTGELPSNARPELNVDATIHAGELNGVTYIERPVNVQSGMTATLYRLTPEQDQASAINVTFGAEAGALIQIIEGAVQGDQLILSDTSRWQQHASIILN